MKTLIFLMAAVITIVIIMAGCGKSASVPFTPNTSPVQTASLTPPITSETTSASSKTSVLTTSSAAAELPVSGGTFRVVAGTGPQVLGGLEGGPGDLVFLAPAVERLMDAAPDRSRGNGLEPVLAETVDDDVAGKRIVFHLRPGVKFHDGSDLNADVVLWTFQRMVAAERLQYANYWNGIRKLDDLTVEINYKDYTNQLIQSWGWTAITSKTAYEKGSGGDDQKGKEWDRNNCVGTGPFMLKEFEKDDHLTWVRNPNYWRPGQPYLDGIEFRFIPDAVTASMLVQSGGADYWIGPPANSLLNLEKQGFQRVSGWAGLIFSIWPNTADPKSKWNDIRLRQALEYALDKPAVASTFGSGDYVPTGMLAPAGEWGYDPDYPARNYDPEKARQLLKDAGYTDGLKAKLLIMSDVGSTAFGSVIKQYLDATGFDIELDTADPGRFYQSVFGNSPGPDLSVMYSGMDINYLVTYMRWFSTDPFTNLAYLGHTPEQKALDEEAKSIPDAAGQKIMTEKLIRALTDDARIVPMYWVPISKIAASYVHVSRSLQAGLRWQTEEIWMQKH